MSARRNPTPSYLRHKQSGRARAVWTDQTGGRQQRLLPGAFDSPESRTAFARLQLELEAAPYGPPAGREPRGVSVNELMLAFLGHAQQHYRRADGTQTHELDEYKLVIRYVRGLYGDTPAADFGPLALKAVRQKFVGAGWCRSLANQRVGRVRRMFKWGASEELVPVAVHQALATVQGLQQGRSEVRESDPVKPVAEAVVAATLPHLNRHVRGLVEFQRLTGCRPGEACGVRRCDIEMGEVIWLYRPAQHKTAWRGRARVVSVGPQAQALLKGFFTPNHGDYLFSPRRAVEELRATRSANRRTPKYPSHMRRNTAKRIADPARRPAERYPVTSYEHAIARACAKAFPAPAPLGQREGETRAEWRRRLSEVQREELAAWQSAHRWAPNRLRHTYGTQVRKDYGLEAAQVLLGHARADVTQVYAEKNEQLAASVAAKIG
jgi:integrase